MSSKHDPTWDMRPDQIEMRQRMREAARKVMEEKFGLPKHDEMISKAMELSANVYELVMQVVNADASKGGEFNEPAAWRLVEKLYLDNLSKWNKDELLFLIVLVQSALTMEKVKEQVESGLIGKQKDYPV